MGAWAGRPRPSPGRGRPLTSRCRRPARSSSCSRLCSSSSRRPLRSSRGWSWDAPGHLSLRDPRRDRGRGWDGAREGGARGARAPGIGLRGNGRGRGPTWLLRRWRCSRSCCSVSSYRHRTSLSCSLSRLGVGWGTGESCMEPACTAAPSPRRPQPSPPQRLLQAGSLSGRLLQAGRHSHQNVLQVPQQLGSLALQPGPEQPHRLLPGRAGRG